MTRTLNEIFDHAQTIEELNAASDEITVRIQEIYDDYDPKPEDFHPNPAGLLYTGMLQRATAEKLIVDGVRIARADHWSWERIGEKLGTSGEAARQRYKDLVA